MKYSLFITLILFLLLNSCKKIWPDDNFSIQKTQYNSNELRIDGYYYNISDADLYTIYFFNRNGILLYGSSFYVDELYEHEIRYSNGEHYNFASEHEGYWGVFDIEDNSVYFEKGWIQNGQFKIYMNTGEILNDTTFKITERYRLKNGKEKEYEEINETYHFKQFSPKPDSTNSFID